MNSQRENASAPHYCLRHISSEKTSAFSRIYFIEPHGDADAAVEWAPFSFGTARGRDRTFGGFAGHGPTPFLGTMVEMNRLRWSLLLRSKEEDDCGERSKAQHQKCTRPGNCLSTITEPHSGQSRISVLMRICRVFFSDRSQVWAPRASVWVRVCVVRRRLP